MAKKFSKILAVILTLGLIATLCATPMSVSADPAAGETYETYDVVEYADFLDTGNNHLSANGVTLSAQHTLLHYDVTSATHSVIYKFRWVAGACSYFQMYPGKYVGDNPFMYRINTGSTGQWVKRYAPGNATISAGRAISSGDEFDIEIGRLKVATGTNAGQYYSYFKVDGTLIFEQYVTDTYYNSVSDSLLDSIQLSMGGTYNSGIKPVPEIPAEQEDPDALYYYYDEIDYNDLKENGNALGTQTQLGSKTFTYTRTANTYSAILKYRWKATSTSKFQLSFDRRGSNDAINYMFGVQLYTPGSEGHTNTSIRLRPGLDDANAWNELDYNIETDEYYDIEFARLKVKNGANAGKYYVYFKINDVMISESYVAANVVDSNGNYTSNPGSTACTLSNEIYLTFWGGGGADKIMHTPSPDVYDDYDEVYYSNFLKGGSLLDTQYQINSKKFTYNQTSASASTVIKYRWKNANTNSNFYLAFDPVPKTSDANAPATVYAFGTMYSAPNGTDNLTGKIWLRIGNGSAQPLPQALVNGNDYDIEYARLKVVGGDNIGKYKLYIKIDDTEGNTVYYEEKYIDANFVDSNGNYTSNTDGAGSGVACSISNSFNMSFWGGGGGNVITNPAYTETYYDYDVVTYDDFRIGGNPLSDSGIDLGSTRTCTYNATSDTYSSVLKFRWTAGNQTFKTSDGSPQAYFVLYYDAWAGSAYPFCFAVKGPNQAGFGATAGEYGSWDLNPSISNNIVHMSEPIVNGNTYDIECGRIKVATGPHKGNYYVFLKVDGELISSYYYDGSNSDGTYGSGSKIGTFSNTILFTSSNNTNKISAIPVPETYEDYDEIGYADLLKNGEPLRVGGADMNGGTTFTYNRTSDTYSVILKYLWKVGSKQKFQLSFDKYGDNTMSYMFGAWLSAPGEETGFDNGRMWLKPGGGPQVDLPSVLTTGSSYNVEFARLKVKTGRNTGKYYMYVKIDDTLIAETYVDASGIATDGTYTSNTDKTFTLSNEIQLNFWGSEHNAIAPYKMTFAGQEGVTADFDDDGVLNASDLVVFRKILLGIIDLSELADGIADFNKDSAVDIRDLVAFKKYLAPVNTYAKSGSLNLGMQEHLLESDGSFVDNTKTATYIADASATMGADTYRLSKPIHSLFYVTSTNGVTVASDNMAQFKAMVAALTAQGITNILYVTDSLMLPYGYSNPSINHNKTCPTPGTQDYEDWLTVNANAFAALATEVPEIKFFEPFNEINLSDTGFEKPGIPWDASASVAANYKYTVAEKAGIMADLCWYISRAVKGVDAANQVTTPSITVGTESIIENNFMSALYNAIDSGAHPAFKASGDKRADNYFTIVNIHAYPEYVTGSSSQDTKVNNIASMISSNIYSIMQAHNDGGSRVWLTETGVSIFGSRTESNGASLLSKFLNKINTNMTYIDTVIFYKVADASASSSITEPEKKFGLFYAGDASSNAYSAKQTAKTVYSFFHNGSTDYSALTALANRYN